MENTRSVIEALSEVTVEEDAKTDLERMTAYVAINNDTPVECDVTRRGAGAGGIARAARLLMWLARGRTVSNMPAWLS